MKHLLRLYAVSQTPNSVRALANLKRICEAELKGQHQIEETPENIKRNARSFGWDLGQFEREGLLAVGLRITAAE